MTALWVTAAATAAVTLTVVLVAVLAARPRGAHQARRGHGARHHSRFPFGVRRRNG